MTCKDCLHYEACKDTHDILDTACRGEFDYEALARGCKNFTDRSDIWTSICDLFADIVTSIGEWLAEAWASASEWVTSVLANI